MRRKVSHLTLLKEPKFTVWEQLLYLFRLCYCTISGYRPPQALPVFYANKLLIDVLYAPTKSSLRQAMFFSYACEHDINTAGTWCVIDGCKQHFTVQMGNN